MALTCTCQSVTPKKRGRKRTTHVGRGKYRFGDIRTGNKEIYDSLVSEHRRQAAAYAGWRKRRRKKK